MAKETHIGMLWFDDKGSLGERVKRAVEYYERKYGKRATWARVGEKVEGEFKLDVKEDSTVLPFHVWVGADDAVD